MLPHAYEAPAAIVLVLGGALACFAGYRLFRVVLAIYGFIVGAMLASSVMGITNTLGMVVAALIGGLVGALIFVFAYFVGIALVGAGLGALAAHLAWSQFAHVDPPAAAVIVCAVVGAVGAMLVQRYVIVIGTAFGGAWTLMVGGLALTGDQLAGRVARGAEVWIFYPFPAQSRRWVVLGWLVLGVFGTVVQLAVTAPRKR
jgi:hypothetical protein